MGAPLVRLSELAPSRAEWTIYVGDDAPRYVPASVKAAGKYVQHCVVCGPFGVQFWWRASNDGCKWYWIEQSG